MKFSIKDFFSKYDQIRSLRIWLHLLRKSLMENFIFYAVAVVETVTPRNWNVCIQALHCYIPFRKTQSIPKKNGENFVDYFPPSKNGMTESASNQNLFRIFAVHSNPSIKKIGIQYLLLRIRFIKSRNRTNMRKNKLFLFLINFNNCFTETYIRKAITTSKDEALCCFS